MAINVMRKRLFDKLKKFHGSYGWETDTILQETINCHLYEKMGYTKTDKIKQINSLMSLVFI